MPETRRDVVIRGPRLALARFGASDLDAVHAFASDPVWTTSAEHRAGELGYTIRRDCWGEGHATEVARLLVELGFGRLGLERLAATCDPDNAASIRVLEKAGLCREGLLRGLYRVRGRRRDQLVFGCLRDDLDEASVG
jgi:RimJ/RimL family protein N-acetyltransferase